MKKRDCMGTAGMLCILLIQQLPDLEVVVTETAFQADAPRLRLNTCTLLTLRTATMLLHTSTPPTNSAWMPSLSSTCLKSDRRGSLMNTDWGSSVGMTSLSSDGSRSSSMNRLFMARWATDVMPTALSSPSPSPAASPATATSMAGSWAPSSPAVVVSAASSSFLAAASSSTPVSTLATRMSSTPLIHASSVSLALQNCSELTSDLGVYTLMSLLKARQDSARSRLASGGPCTITSCRGFIWLMIFLMESPSERPS
ncbi:hypothetical protein CRUP_022852 [Coryphaenoides rupestris]|nr:hypothetical protein CRUP_022852 [Coryphaenoides rupestris]